MDFRIIIKNGVNCLVYDEIVNNAISRADSFIKNGVWNK